MSFTDWLHVTRKNASGGVADPLVYTRATYPLSAEKYPSTVINYWGWSKDMWFHAAVVAWREVGYQVTTEGFVTGGLPAKVPPSRGRYSFRLDVIHPEKDQAQRIKKKWESLEKDFRVYDKPPSATQESPRREKAAWRRGVEYGSKSRKVMDRRIYEKTGVRPWVPEDFDYSCLFGGLKRNGLSTNNVK